MVRGTDTRGTRLSPEDQYERMLAETVRTLALQSFAECLRECSLMEGRHFYDKGICISFLKLRFVDE